MATDRIGHLFGERKTLKWRMVAVLLVAAMLPLILSGFGSWVVFRDMLEQKSYEQMRSLVKSHARAIEDHLTERLHLLQFTADSHTFGEMSDIKQLQRILSDLNRSSNQSFIDLGVIDANGDHVAYIGPYDLLDRDYSQEDWFKEVMISGRYISDVFLGFRQVPHCIIAVRAEDDSEQWVLRATINSDQFDELVRIEVLGEGSDAYILNRQAQYQTTPMTGKVLDYAPVPPIGYHAGVHEQRVETNGSVKILVTTWINENRWMLVVEQDLAAIQEPVDRAIADGAILVAIAMLLLVATTFIATWHLTSRIDKANAQREEMSQAFMRSAKLASIGELATGLAHEINNPLAIISAEQTNISDLLRDPETSQEEHEQALGSADRIKSQVQRCANITRKMLQFGRSEQSQLEPIDIIPRLTEIVEFLKRRASVRNVEIILKPDETLPQGLVDPIELEQVLVNLINNSIDALPDGGEIAIRAYTEKDDIHLEVIDNGIGMQAGESERIFEPFYTTKPVGKGTGLGLSVCYGIVQSWGGKIWAESKQGKGTTMHVRLPLQPRSRTRN
jgi:two-component system NtrC family sensor kinase